jgi:hypothetical protein
VNCPTIRCSTPVAATRTGQGSIALPRDPGLDRLLADPNLGSTAKNIATVLVKHWAWVKDHCWPSDRTIADKVGKSPGQVQRGLRQLEDAGWITRQRTDQVPNGRLIRLLWRSAPLSADAQRVPAPTLRECKRRRSTNIVVVKEEEKESEQFAREERPRPELVPAPLATPTLQASEPPAEKCEEIFPQSSTPAPTAALPPLPAPQAEVLVPGPQDVARAIALPPAAPAPAPAPQPAKPSQALPLTPEQAARLAELPEATRDLVLTWLMLGDPILVAEANRLLTPPRSRSAAPKTLPEVLTRIREDPSFPALAADWLSSALQDRKSYSGFKARCEEAWRGELPVERLLSAYEQAMGPRARNPGALFMFALRGDVGDG